MKCTPLPGFHMNCTAPSRGGAGVVQSGAPPPRRAWSPPSTEPQARADDDGRLTMSISAHAARRSPPRPSSDFPLLSPTFHSSCPKSCFMLYIMWVFGDRASGAKDGVDNARRHAEPAARSPRLAWPLTIMPRVTPSALDEGASAPLYRRCLTRRLSMSVRSQTCYSIKSERAYEFFPC